MPIFPHSRWNSLLDQTFAEIRKLSALKGGEYSGDADRLLNFRRNASALGLRMETIWAVYAAKHWDAILQYISDEQAGRDKRQRLESIEGRVDDLLTYLLLFKAMLQESASPAERWTRDELLEVMKSSAEQKQSHASEDSLPWKNPSI